MAQLCFPTNISIFQDDVQKIECNSSFLYSGSDLPDDVVIC